MSVGLYAQAAPSYCCSRATVLLRSTGWLAARSMKVPKRLPAGTQVRSSVSVRATCSLVGVWLFRLFRQSFLRLPCVFGTAVERRHVVMVSILSVDGYFVGANGGCQTPCL